jgi:hypothetical protein
MLLSERVLMRLLPELAPMSEILCARASDVDGRGIVPAPGSERRKCGTCGEDCYLSPASLALHDKRPKDWPVICADCLYAEDEAEANE